MEKKWTVLVILIAVIAGFFITQETDLAPQTHIYKPGLSLNVDIDKDVIQGNIDVCDGTVTVRNVGGDIAHNVTVEVRGLDDSEYFQIGNLLEGEEVSKDFNLSTFVSKGDYEVVITTTCNEGVSDSETKHVHVAGVI